MATDGPDIAAEFVADEESLRHLEKVIGDAIARGFEQGFEGLKGLFSANFTRQAEEAQRQFAKGFQASARTGQRAYKAMFDDMSKRSQEVEKQLKRLTDQGFAGQPISSAIAKSAALERQDLITLRGIQDRALQERKILLERESSAIAQAARTQGELQVNAAKVSGKQRVQITRSILETIGRLEKGFGAAIAGAARTSTSAISKVYSTLTSTLRRSNSAFTDGLPRAMRTRETEMRSSFNRQERIVRESTLRQQRILTDLNTRVSTGVLGATTGRGVGGGLGLLAGGAGIAGLLTSGFRRFSDLERINKQFLALTGSIEQTDLLLAQVKQFAKETPFDLVGVADLAKGFLAIKTPVDQVLPRVQAIADAVALTGGGVDELNRIQRAIGQIVSTGKLQGDELNQLAENLPGLNVRQILADQLTGGNVQTLVALQEAGELSADAVVNGLITGLASDPRLQGASGDLAKTLGGRVANLKESFADFGASIIGTIAEPLKLAVTTTQVVLQGLSDFIKGEGLGPGLMIVRDALKGIAIALALVFAAKGGVETLQLLSVASRALLSPFGVLLITVGLLGAAISVMASRSEPLRKTLGELGDRFGAAGKRIREELQPALDAVSGFINKTLIPAIDTAAQFLADHLLGALDATISFITDTALPALDRMATIVGGKLGPAWDFVAGKVTDFFDTVRPFLQPAITGFSQLGDAIGRAFGGDFSGLRSGAAGALSGIGQTVANIAGAVAEALTPVARQVLLFFTELFSGPNLKKYASAFLGFVEEIGRVIGSIVSSPIFLKAVAGIAAAAVVIAFKFTQGFVEGVSSHLGDIAALGGELLVAIGKGILANLPQVITAVFVVMMGRKLLASFRTMGKEGGDGYLAGFRGALSGGRGFLSGLFSGGVMEGPSTASLKAWETEVRTIQNRLRVLGSASTFDMRAPAGIQAARDELRRLEGSFTSAQKKGMVFRDNMRIAFSQLKTVFQGSLGIGKGLAQGVAAAFTAIPKALGESKILSSATQNLINATIGDPRKYVTAANSGAAGFLTTLKSSFTGAKTQIASSWSTMMDGIRTSAAERGTSIGKTMAGGIALGLTGALAGLQIGKQIGNSTTTGGALLGLGELGATSLAIGSISPAAGIATFAVGALSAAFTGAGRAATEAKKIVTELAASVRNELGQAVADGVVALSDFENGLLGLGDVAGLDSVGKKFKDALGTDGLQTIDQFGITWKNTFLPILEAGGDLDTIQSKMSETFLTAATASDEFNSRLKGNAPEVAALLREMIPTGRDVAAVIGEIDAGNRQVSEGVREALGNHEGFLNQIIFTEGDLRRGAEQTQAALELVNLESRQFGSGIDSTPVVREIGGVDDALGVLSAKMTTVKGQLLGLFSEGINASVTSSLLTASGLGQQIDGLAALGPIAAGAQRDQILLEFSNALGNSLQAGIDAGFVLPNDPVSARQAMQPTIDALLESIDDPATRAEWAARLNALADSQALTVAANVDMQAAITANVDMQAAITAGSAGLEDVAAVLQASLDTNPALQVAFSQIQASGGDEAVQQVTTDILTALAGDEDLLAAAGSSTGKAVIDGLALGMLAKRLGAIAAAQRIADGVVAAMNTRFGIRSPSKVAMGIGRFIGEGLALGLADSAAKVSDVVGRVVDEVVARMRSGVDRAAEVSRELGAALFGALTGSDAGGTARAGGLAAVTNAMQSFLSTVSSNVGTVFDIAKKAQSDLTAADRNIIGESAFSLDARDVLGASNLAALEGALDAIAALGEQMLQTGESATTVTAAMQAQIDALVAAAVGLGFNQTEVLALVDALGLSSSALADFLDELRAAQDAAAASPTPNTLPTPSSQAAANAPTAWITNYITLPSGDPEAAALAVANKQASLLWG